jgi:hypothetical protein
MKSIDKFSDLIGNQRRDLPACSIVPQPTMLPRAPLFSWLIIKIAYFTNILVMLWPECCKLFSLPFIKIWPPPSSSNSFLFLTFPVLSYFLGQFSLSILSARHQDKCSSDWQKPYSRILGLDACLLYLNLIYNLYKIIWMSTLLQNLPSFNPNHLVEIFFTVYKGEMCF